MALTVGTNSYISVDDAEDFFEARLHSTAWTGASGSDKPAALMQATRMLDELMDWIGVPAVEGQALRWPRKQERPCVPFEILAPVPALLVPDFKLRDRDGNPIAEDEIPQKVKDAVCEQAIYLLSLDPTQKPKAAQKGLRSGSLGTMNATFDSDMRPDLLCQAAIAALAGLGSPLGSATVGGASIGVLGRA